jgi:hypothetical protein
VLLASREFRKRPSKLLGILERGVAFDFDCAAALWMRRMLPTAEELILKGLSGQAEE